MIRDFFRLLLASFSLFFVWLIATSFMPLEYLSFSETDTIKPPFLLKQYPEIDSIMATMSLDEKIAQMLMMPVYPEQGQTNFNQVKQWIDNNKIGGVIFFKGHPSVVKKWNAAFQKNRFLPLFSAIDGEWGVSMRLDSAVVFPKQMTLGAAQNDSLIFRMGQEIARECQWLGLNINFAPVVDVNTNPKNIIIGYRSFGVDKKIVARKGYFYAAGMQSQGILAVAKHFPGHGDTEKDSHKTLPVLKHDSLRLFATELYPFEQMFRMGVGGVMVAHLLVPAFEKQPNVASTLSHHIVTDILKKRLQFNGLVFTDALNMKGVSAYWSPEELLQKAVLAGNDILLMPPDVENTISIIKKMVADKQISEVEINHRVRKILTVKCWMRDNSLKNDSLPNPLESIKEKRTQEALYTAATTLIKNEDNLLPLNDLANLDAAIITIGKSPTAGNTFAEYLRNYRFLTNNGYSFGKFINLNTLPQKISKHKTLIVGVMAPSRYPKNNYGVPKAVFQKIETLAKNHKIILVVFGSPYLLGSLNNTEKYAAILTAYENNKLVQHLVAEQLFGVFPISGKLPVTAGEFSIGNGISTQSLNRLRYEQPEMEGMNSDTLKLIDTIAQSGIDDGAYPGCQILVARNGAVIYRKNFGYLTYDKKIPVTDTTIYDLASVTKPLATTLALMKLYDERKFKLTDKLSKYLPALDTTNKKDLFFQEVMTHQAGLVSWIPFYLRTIRNTALFDSIYSNTRHGQYLLPVAKNMFMDTAYVWEIYHRIYGTDLKEKTYKYSDIGFYILKKIIEKVTGESLDKFVNAQFYAHLGTDFAGFNLWQKYPQNQFAPTERDTFFRHQVVQGFVHDYGAAMMGGVCGHAGLFANAGDLAKILQMLLNGGTYGGKNYLSDTTIKRFTSCPYCPESRRGIGFDKPEKDPDKNGPTCDKAPAESYGHSGFTGVLVWNDPENNLIYIFLSNRVYPDIENKKLLNSSIRTRIQDVIYRSIKK
ncbi:MAG: serine hydrolase [Bacteroidales bacterium]|nr:serine hydrolase [Bacteroidales bacterium]